MKNILISAIILHLLILTSCSAIYSTIYGIKAPKQRTPEQIQKFAKKYKIPASNLFVIDTSYLSFIDKIDTSQKILAKNHSQPLQALYFNHSGNLISYHQNCNAGGFPNLKWNRNGILESFVPKSQTQVDTLINFNRQVQFLRTLENEKPNHLFNNTADYNVVVYWSIFMGRQSKRFIKYIKNNCKLADKNRVNLIFVNNDNLYLLADD